MSYFKLFMSYNFLVRFVFLFLIFLLIKSIVYLLSSLFKKEMKWNERFYHSIEAVEDSELTPKDIWQVLTKVESFSKLDFNNRIAWIKIDGPLRSDILIKIKLKKGGQARGILTTYEENSKLAFAYRVWPSLTRFNYEILMEPLSNGKTRCTVRLKMKKVLIPVLKIISPNLTKQASVRLSEALKTRLTICKELISNQSL